MAFGGKKVLLIGGEGVVLYGPQGSGVVREASVSWEVPNFEEQLVSALKARNAGKSVVVLFDDSDQAYKKEEVPSTIGFFDRGNYVKRKISQLFPSHPIRGALEVKPAKPKGLTLTKAPTANMSYLFVALPDLERLDVIGNALLESGVPVAGFALLPLESEGLVGALATKLFSTDGKRSRWAAIIGQQETGGIRQVFIKDGRLAMTRLIRTSDAGTSGAGWAEEAAREFKASISYISRIGFTPGEGLDLVVVCGEVEKQFFDAKTLQVTGFQALTAQEALQTIGARSPGLEKGNFADAVYAAWVGRKNALTLPVRVPSIHRIMAPRLGARVGSAFLFLAVLGFLFMLFQDYTDYSTIQDDITASLNQKTMVDREYEDEAKVFDALPVKPDVVKAVIGVKKGLEDATINLAPTLNTLKKVLGEEIFTTELNFSHDPPASLSLEGVPGVGGPFAAPDPAKAKGTVTLTFKFVLPDSMNLEQKVTKAETLQKSLEAAFAGYKVTITNQFGRVSRDGAYTGNLNEAGANGPSDADAAEIQLVGPPL